MKILLAPAETKMIGGDKPPYCKDNFYFNSFLTIEDRRIKTLIMEII